MKKIMMMSVILILIGGWGIHSDAAENRPHNHDQYDELVNPVLKLAAESEGAFLDAMKSFIAYTAMQNVPGAKESGVGYYYDHKKKRLERTLFWRFGQGQPRETGRLLDFKVNGKGFFVIQLPGGWPAYTHDGRFDIDKQGRLVMMAHPFPVLGENGIIYLPDKNVSVDENGVIEHNGDVIDVLRIEWVRDPIKNLQAFTHAIFYLKKEDWDSREKNIEPSYTIMQGYIEDSSITKAYIGLVPEWKAGMDGNVKVIKSYVKNIQGVVQLANP